MSRPQKSKDDEDTSPYGERDFRTGIKTIHYFTHGDVIPILLGRTNYERKIQLMIVIYWPLKIIIIKRINFLSLQWLLLIGTLVLRHLKSLFILVLEILFPGRCSLCIKVSELAGPKLILKDIQTWKRRKTCWPERKTCWPGSVFGGRGPRAGT